MKKTKKVKERTTRTTTSATTMEEPPTPSWRRKPRARLTLTGLESMTVDQRRAIAVWLSDQSRSLRRDGARYANTYTARYW